MWLIIGGESTVGSAVTSSLRVSGEPVLTTTRRLPITTRQLFLDLAEPLRDWEPPNGIHCACICAAVTELKACEALPQVSKYVNVTQTLEVIDRLLVHGVHVIFISSNHVFDGNVAYVAADAPRAPVSEYGHQKARVEEFLVDRLHMGAPVAILRLSKVFAPHDGIVANWIEVLSAERQISAFSDMFVAPVPLVRVVAAVRALGNARATGIYQLSGPRDVSYLAVAELLARRLGKDRTLISEALASDADLPRGAAPDNTTLDSSALASMGIEVPDIEQILDALVTSNERTDLDD